MVTLPAYRLSETSDPSSDIKATQVCTVWPLKPGSSRSAVPALRGGPSTVYALTFMASQYATRMALSPGLDLPIPLAVVQVNVTVSVFADEAVGLKTVLISPRLIRTWL